MEELSGGPGMVWLAVRSGSHGPHDASADPRALEILAPLLEHADATGVELALYPHSGFWLETSEDALRLLSQVEHPRLGLCFNLCHFLKGHEGADPLPLLEAAGERLFAVTLNGADAAEDWGRLIQPLGEGDLDLGPLLDGLDRLGHRGPVGLQAFGIREPSAAHLGRSMAAWRALQESEERSPRNPRIRRGRVQLAHCPAENEPAMSRHPRSHALTRRGGPPRRGDLARLGGRADPDAFLAGVRERVERREAEGQQRLHVVGALPGWSRADAMLMLPKAALGKVAPAAGSKLGLKSVAGSLALGPALSVIAMVGLFGWLVGLLRKEDPSDREPGAMERGLVHWATASRTLDLTGRGAWVLLVWPLLIPVFVLALRYLGDLFFVGILGLGMTAGALSVRALGRAGALTRAEAASTYGTVVMQAGWYLFFVDLGERGGYSGRLVLMGLMFLGALRSCSWATPRACGRGSSAC